MKINRTYTLHKSRKILRASFKLFNKKAKYLSTSEKNSFEEDLQALDHACVQGNRTEADRLAKKIETFSRAHFKKTPFEFFIELSFAIIVALSVAVVVRGSWFELYEIPTGSMRPTFKEKDHLTVSKVQYGINVPLTTEHFYFDPQEVKRTGVVIWSGAGIEGADDDTTYFGFLPYKKRYIKRLMGKPGDTLYFYGGKLYGIDEKGNPLNVYLDSSWMKNLEYIPFMSFEGEMSSPKRNEIVYKLMNIPIGKFSVSVFGDIQGEIFNGQKWIPDTPTKSPHNEIQTYSDIWGIGNFAMSRLLRKNEVELYSNAEIEESKDAPLYLELRHNPDLKRSKIIRGTLFLEPYVSLIPLSNEQINTLMNNMYTARFIVKNNRAYRYGNKENSNGPKFPGVSDGTYEFYHGKAYRVNSLGITTELAKDHPLYNRSPENVQKLYNLGFRFNKHLSPQSKNQIFFPHRYTYFRDGDLYTMGGILLKENDPTLNEFISKEIQKEKNSSNTSPYVAFVDHGPPQKDGKLNTDFIEKFGLKIPENKYLVLGDNHAMSSDSRVFGFIPEDNLQGVPSLILWPPGNRLGTPSQYPYPIFTTPRIIVWAIALIIFTIFSIFYRRSLKKALFKNSEQKGESKKDDIKDSK